VSAN